MVIPAMVAKHRGLERHRQTADLSGSFRDVFGNMFSHALIDAPRLVNVEQSLLVAGGVRV